MHIITARRAGLLVTEEGATSRAAADELLGVIARENPDCEITMQDGGVVLLTMGPAEPITKIGVMAKVFQLETGWHYMLGLNQPVGPFAIKLEAIAACRAAAV